MCVEARTFVLVHVNMIAPDTEANSFSPSRWWPVVPLKAEAVEVECGLRQPVCLQTKHNRGRVPDQAAERQLLHPANSDASIYGNYHVIREKDILATEIFTALHLPREWEIRLLGTTEQPQYSYVHVTSVSN